MGCCCCRRPPRLAALNGGFAPPTSPPFDVFLPSGGGFSEPAAGGAPAPVLPLLNFNPGEVGPDTIPFPTTNAALTALGLPAATAILPMEDAAGAGVVTETVAGNNLTPAGTFSTGKRGKGLWNGTDFFSKLAVESQYGSGTSKANAAAAGVFDFDETDSFVWLFIYRTLRNSSNYTLFSKQGSAVNPGYSVWFTPGSLYFRYDGGPTVDSFVTATGVHGWCWHIGAAIVNRTTQEMQLRMDIGDGTRQDISGSGSPSTATVFSLGDGGVSNSNGFQIAWMALFTGAAALDVDTNWDTYWPILFPHGTHNKVTTPLTYKDCTSNVTTIIGEDDQGIVYTDWSTPANVERPDMQFPWAWNTSFTHTSKLGLASTNSHQNLLYDSENTVASGFGAVTMNRLYDYVADLADAPNGMHTAHRLLTTAAGGYWYYNHACVASTVYSFDLFLKRFAAMGADVAGRLIAYDNTHGAEIAAQAFSATTLWQRVALTFTTPVGCVNVGFRVEITNDAESINVARFTSRIGELSNPVVKIAGGAFMGTASLTDFRIGGIAGQYMKGAQGEIVIHYICNGNDAASRRYIQSAAPGNDRRLTRIESSEDDSGIFYDGAGVFTQQDITGVVDQSLEHTLRLRWNMVTPLPCGRYTEAILDGVSTPGAAAPMAYGNANTDIYVGQNYTSLDQLDGIIDYIKIWEQPQ